jgi:ABC-2 type transport system ATP-binding protein
MQMIEVDKLTKSFGPIQAVRGVSFDVAKGEVLGFLGPNGAGKSTTMKMITGFLSPTSGTARVCGNDILKAPLESKRHIGYLPEGAPLYADMTPVGFLEFVAGIRRIGGAERRAAVKRAIEMTQLEGVVAQPIETLSKGFKRRVGLAQALLHDPDVLILDEPTDGLDPNQKQEVRQIIAELASEKAILISTHILEEVDAVCSRAIIIAQGTIVADGTPAELEARSRLHNAVTILFDTAISASERKELGALPGVAAVEDVNMSDGKALRAIAKDGKSIAGTVGDFVRNKKWSTSEIRIERGHLDDVFREITRPKAGDKA